MSRIRIAVFEERARAEPVRLRLAREGVPAEVHGEIAWAKLWFVSARDAGFRLEVPARDAERAAQLLLDWDTRQGLLHDAIRCPECRSLQVDFPQFTEKSVFTNVVFGLLAELGLLEREFYCQDCHHMWTKPGVRPRRVRPHGGPDYFLEDIHPTVPRATPTPAAEAPSAPPVRSYRTRGHGRSQRFGNRSRPGTRLRWGIGFALLLGAGRPLVVNGEMPGAAGLAAQRAGATLTRASRPAGSLSNQTNGSATDPTYARDVLPILMGKCARCHNDQSRMLRNLLDYQVAARDRWEIKRRIWDSWHGTYFKQPMPTGNSPESLAMTAEERATIRDWVESGARYGVAPAVSDAQSRPERLELGKRLFTTVCAACHQPGGQGLPARFPPLAGSDFLNADKHRAIKTVVNGLQGEIIVNGRKFNNSMPRFPLSDGEVASALTYVYSSFGNSGQEVTPQEVSTVRTEKDTGNSALSTQASKVPEEKSPFE